MMSREEARALCDLCDEWGMTVSPVTGAKGRCRHPYLEYEGHEREDHE